MSILLVRAAHGFWYTYLGGLGEEGKEVKDVGIIGYTGREELR